MTETLPTSGIRCPECGAGTGVIRSRETDTGMRIHRRRECANGHHFNTNEREASQPRTERAWALDWQI